MADEPSDFTSSDAPEFSDSDELNPPDWASEFGDSSEAAVPASFAVDIAKIWVQEHQKTSMLGAFAVGVFVGAMLRD